MGRPRTPVADRFWPKIDKDGPNGCWLWTSVLNDHGYGMIRLGGRGERTIRAHRFSYELHFGPIPDGMSVCHTCDNPPCVNPAHLFLGTMADNMADKVRKGRGRNGGLKGVSHGRAKLTEADVLVIRHSTELGTILAQRYGVSTGAIYSIKHRRLWTHVPD